MANELTTDPVTRIAADIGVPHTIVLGSRDPASLQTRFVVRCTECRDEEVVVITRDDMALVRNNDDAIKAGLAIRARLKEAAELHRRLAHVPMTHDAARVLVARALRECFPDRAEEILRALEKGPPVYEKSMIEDAMRAQYRMQGFMEEQINQLMFHGSAAVKTEWKP